MVRAFRIWWYTRWFMKHWQVNRDFARQMAIKRTNYLERMRHP